MMVEGWCPPYVCPQGLEGAVLLGRGTAFGGQSIPGPLIRLLRTPSWFMVTERGKNLFNTDLDQMLSL